MNPNQVTPLILTFNEEANINHCLAMLEWARQIVIVDSNSTDQTVKLASGYPNVTVVQRPFDSFANQCNFGLEHVTTDWVLSLDADYVVTPELREQIRMLDPNSSVAGYSVDFRYCIFGQPLRSSLYPARTVLYRRKLAQYRNEGHGHRVTVDGKIEKLLGKIDHDDRKPLSRWIQSQDGYARLEAEHLLEIRKRGKAETLKWGEERRKAEHLPESGKGKAEHLLELRRAERKGQSEGKLKLQDKLRLKIFFAPIVMFFYLLFGRGLILDGWRGWYYVAQRVIAELLLSLRLIEAKKVERRN